jgi:tetratricopeptide (TPR) repeat protein
MLLRGTGIEKYEMTGMRFYGMHMEVLEMERYASSLKMKEIKRLSLDKQYLKAMKILETLNVDKIRSMSDLSVIAEVLIHNDEYEDAMEILLRIYERSCSRRIIEQLIDVSIKMKNMEETKEYYKEYLRIAPKDPYRLVLRYRIEKANHVPYAQRIETLVQLKQEDYMEEWAYELAKLYHKTGQVDKCVDECSDIILWFGQGIIVEKARLLKEHYTSGFNITDNLKAGEFDATKSLEEVIRQVKQKRGISQHKVVNQQATVASALDIDSTVSDSNQFDNDALYLNSGKAADMVSIHNDLEEEKTDYQVEENELDEVESTQNQEEYTKEAVVLEDQPIEQSMETPVEAEYVLTPDVVKEVRARVSGLKSETMEVEEPEKEIGEEDKLQDSVQEESTADLQQNNDSTLSIDDEPEETSIEEQTSMEEKTLEEEQTSMEEKTLEEEQTYTEEKTLEEEQTSTEEKTLEEDQTSMEEKTSTKEQNSEEEHFLTEEELQKMKAKMKKLQENDVTKTYRHDSPDIVEDGDITYAYGVNLNTIFQNFINNESIKNQLLSILKNMDSRKRCNNFMICGDIQTGKTSLARAIAIAMWKLKRIPTKKVAKINALKLNEINLIEKMEQLADGSLVIENAGLLNSNTVKSIIQMIEHYDGRILVLFEERTRNMEELMNKEQELRTFFTHRIILPRYTSQDIADFAYNMIKQQEYEVADDAMEYLAIKIEQIYRVTPSPEQLARVKVYVGELIKKAETRNMLLLMKQAKEGKFSQSITNVITIDDITD